MSLETFEDTNRLEIRQISTAFSETSTRIVLEDSLIDYDWRDSSACKGTFPYPFFPIIFNERTKARETREAIAKEICAICPVIESCLDYAVNNEEHGIWGGLTEAERYEKFGVLPYAPSNVRFKNKLRQ